MFTKIRKALKKILALALTGALLFGLLPAFAPVTAAEWTYPGVQYLTSANGVSTATDDSGYSYLENGYIRFGFNPSTNTLVTIPAAIKNQTADYISRSLVQKPRAYFYTYQGAGNRVTKAVDMPTAYQAAFTADNGILVRYYFTGKDIYNASYSFNVEMRYRLVKVGAAEGDYGVQATMYLSAGEIPRVFGDSDYGFEIALSFEQFPNLGHKDINAADVTPQAVSYAVSYGTPIGEPSYTNIAKGMSAVKTSGDDGRYITEVVCNSYNWANPFVALSSVYAGFGDLVYPSYVQYNAASLDLTVRGDHFPYLADVNNLTSRPGAFLWGFRGLVNAGTGATTPPDQVTVPQTANRVAIFKKGGGYFAESASDDADLAALTRQNGAPVAVIRGNLKSVYDGGMQYHFTDGQAMLSPTVAAKWPTDTGYLVVYANGAIYNKAVSLSSPSFKFYSPTNPDRLVFLATATGISASMDPDVNKAVISVDIPYTTTKVSGAHIAPDGNITFSGELSLATLFNGAKLTIEKLGYGLKSGQFTVNGVKASGRLSTADMFSLELADISGSINTFPNEELYHFELDLNVFDLFETEAELTLKRLLGNGALIPDDLYFFIGAQPGIPLVPPIVVARLTGGGAGFYDLADTVNGDFFAIPPIKLRGTTGVSLLNFVDATGSSTFGPGSWSTSLSEIKLAGSDAINIIDKFEVYASLSGQTRGYEGTDYKGLLLSAGTSLGAKIPSATNDWIVLDGGLNFGAFAGLNNYSSPSRLYMLIGGNSGISGKLQFPSGWAVVGGKTVMSAELQAALGVEALIEVDAGWKAAFQSIYKNADIYFGVMGQATVLGTKVRVWYVLPPNGSSYYDYSIKPPFFSLSDWKWSDHGIPTFSVSSLAALYDNDTGEQIGLAGMEMELPAFTEATTLQPFSDGPQTVNFAAGDSTEEESMYILVVPDGELDEAGFEIFKSSLAVTDITSGSTPLNLTWAEELNTEVLPAELEDVNATPVTSSEGKQGVLVYVGKGGVAQSYEFDANSGFTLHTGALPPAASFSATFGGDTVAATVNNPEEGKTYVMRTYLGAEAGGTDYLIDQRTVANSENVPIPTSGAAIPTGSYYVTSFLMEETRGDFNGDETIDETEVAYLTVGSEEFTTIDYTNSEQPEAPASATIAASGNEVMTATWAEVAGADGYSVAIYQDNAGDWEDTGAGYQFDAADFGSIPGMAYDDNTDTYSMNMALTVGGEDESGTQFALDADETYKIGVRAYKYTADEDNDAINDVNPVYSAETESNGELLPAYVPLNMTILFGQGTPNFPLAPDMDTGVYTASVKSAGYYIKPEDSNADSFTVSRTDTDEVITPDGSGYAIPEFEGTLLLKVEGFKTHDSVTDVTERFVLIQYDDAVPVITLDSDAFRADPVTGVYTITGITEPGSTVEVVYNALLNTTVGDDGRFSITGNLEEQTENENLNGDIETGYAGGSVSLMATDIAGNESEKASALVLAGVGFVRGSSEADVAQVVSPAGASLSGTDITATVAGASSVALDVTVSENAVWKLYSDAACTDELTDRAMTLSTGENTAYLMVIAENGTTKLYTVTVTRTSSPSTQPSGGGGSSGGRTAVTSAAISVSTATYDKESGEDIVVTLTPGSHTLTAIKNGGATLGNGTDYTVSGDTVTIKSGYLSSLAPGQHKLTFDMSGGSDPVLTITIEDSEPPLADLADWENPFTDVNKSAWYYDNVAFVHQNGLFAGLSATTFGPDVSMTRGMLVTVLGRLYGADASKYTTSSFGDVAASRYYAPYIEWAKQAGIVSGIGDNKFAPDAEITRQDLAAIITRYAEYANKQFPATRQFVTFADDAQIADYAKSSVQSLYNGGIISGKPNNIFDPTGNATRAEVAAMMHRFIEAAK